MWGSVILCMTFAHLSNKQQALGSEQGTKIVSDLEEQ